MAEGFHLKIDSGYKILQAQIDKKHRQILVLQNQVEYLIKEKDDKERANEERRRVTEAAERDVLDVASSVNFPVYPLRRNDVPGVRARISRGGVLTVKELDRSDEQQR